MDRDGGGAAKKRRTACSRRPHSQPDKLLSCMNSPTHNSNNGEGSSDRNLEEDQPAAPQPTSKSIRTFKRRDTVSIVKAEIEEPQAKRHRQRVVLEASDEESSEGEPPAIVEKKGRTRSRQEAPPLAKPAANEGLALRKSSRVVKRRAFDDDEQLEEVKRRSRKLHELEKAQMKLAEAATASGFGDNADSGEDELPRKRTRKGSIQDIQASTAATLVKEKPPTSTSRQRAPSQHQEKRTSRAKAAPAAAAKELHEQASSSGKEDVLKVDSPGSSVQDSETRERTIPLTARQRSLQAWKDGEANPNLIEFPEGLNNFDRKRKAKLSEEEKLAKKAEAASKRKQQVEKAAKEIQETAIQKILNQDSNRKKREERIQKQKQEIAEGKKAAEQEVPTNSIRVVMGPSGTTVSFAQDVQLPPLFSSAPLCYPSPREKCTACSNTYKYRDSKSNVPLCSIQCYKAVQNKQAAALEVPPAF